MTNEEEYQPIQYAESITIVHQKEIESLKQTLYQLIDRLNNIEKTSTTNWQEKENLDFF